MLAIFCLRLAWGMIAALLILPTAEVHPRFFRVQYLSVLGILTVAGFFTKGLDNVITVAAYAITLLACCLGSIVWHLDGAPLARLTAGTTIAALTCLILMKSLVASDSTTGHALMIADDLTAAALLGSCISAMLMGHSYLIASAMSLTPLMRLLAAIAVTVMLRFLVATLGIWQWQLSHSQMWVHEIVFMLILRWTTGFFFVLWLTWMAWESARIRSTQSATGILYVVVIVCFIGELTSQLLVHDTGFIL